MALAEAEHPLAQEMATILLAAEKGIGESDFLPPRTTYEYIDPLNNASGAAVLLLSSLLTENFTAIHIPVFSDLETGLGVMSQEGISLTEARIKVVDMHGRDFPIDTGEEVWASRYIQFDLDEDGVIFSAHPNGAPLTLYGRYESEEYDRWSRHARAQASLSQLHAASIQFLGQVA